MARPGKKGKATAEAPSRAGAATGRGGFFLPFALTLVLFAISFVPRVAGNAVLQWSFWGAAAALGAFQVALFWNLGRAGEGRALQLFLRPQHYVQAAVQFSVYAYWGFFWRPVYDYLWLLFAQLVFAYAFDILLQWSRKRDYALGFGPFPIIFSTNLFLWFKDDWFYLQFLLVTVGMLGKEFVRWEREGKRVHIFNPSAFSLGLFSLVILLTGSTDMTWAPEVASTLSLAPYMYSYLFLVGLVVMYFFSTTLVSGMTAATLFGLSALYATATGVPYFLDSEIPTAVFLGLHLLVTDPSTSPRSPLGKSIFGVLYGLSVFALYGLLGALGQPTFYDKLMAVPLLNLMVPRIDALVVRIRASPRWRRLDWFPSRPNLAHMGIWIAFFGTMTLLGRTDGRHPGDSVPFWVQACEEGRPNACERVVLLENSYCNDNSGWACNEVGILYQEGTLVDQDPDRALGYFSLACELRYQPACLNVLTPGAAISANPRAFDLRLLLREGGLNLMEMPEGELYARACEHQWAFACERRVGSL